MDGIRIRVRADGRSYQLQMKHNSFDTYSFHYAEFETLPGEWMTIEVSALVGSSSFMRSALTVRIV